MKIDGVTEKRFLNLGVAKDEVLCVAMMDQIKMDQMRMVQILDCQHTFEKSKLIKSKVIGVRSSNLERRDRYWVVDVLVAFFLTNFLRVPIW